MKKLYIPLFLLLFIAAFSACKKDKSVTPLVVSKAVGSWNADKAINENYDSSGKLQFSDTTVLHNTYIFNLKNDGTGNVLVSGKTELTFKYSLTDTKINYSSVVYYNLDGTRAGTEADYFETMPTLTNTNMVTVLEQDFSDGTGKSLTTIYFTKQ